MGNENLINELTDGKVTVIPFGGDAPQIDFNLSDWQKAYLINGSYATRNPDGSIRTVENDYYKNNKNK